MAFEQASNRGVTLAVPEPVGTEHYAVPAPVGGSGVAGFFSRGVSDLVYPKLAPAQSVTTRFAKPSLTTVRSRPPLSFGQAAWQVLPQTASIMFDVGIGMVGGTLLSLAPRFIRAARSFNALANRGLKDKTKILPLGKTWSWSLDRSRKAWTEFDGSIFLNPVRVPKEMTILHALRHEWFHSQIRSPITNFLYQYSDLWRFLEESAAYTFQTNSLRSGLAMAARHEDVNRNGAVLDLALVAAVWFGVWSTERAVQEVLRISQPRQVET